MFDYADAEGVDAERVWLTKPLRKDERAAALLVLVEKELQGSEQRPIRCSALIVRLSPGCAVPGSLSRCLEQNGK